DTVDILRKWHRWCDRMKELGGTLPDRELEAIIHRTGSKDNDKAKEANAAAGAKVKGVEEGTPVTLEALNAQIESLRAMAQEHEDMKDLERAEVTLAGESKEVSWSKRKGLKVIHPRLGPLKAELQQLSSPVDPTESIKRFGFVKTSRVCQILTVGTLNTWELTFGIKEAWKEFQQWARVKTIDFCQGSLGHEWLRCLTNRSHTTFRLAKRGDASVLDDMPGAPDEYEPTEIGDDHEDASLDFDQYVDEVHAQHPATMITAVDGPDDKDGMSQKDDNEPSEYEWIDDKQLEQELQKTTNPVEMITLRYFVGLKSKTGPDVAAGIQQMILRITQKFPVRILHCDPGTEFTSEALMKWLPGWFKSRARTLLASSAVPPTYWPIAMRWAAEAHNRSVLGQEPIPAFGQTVLHKLKKPAGGHKELITRWVKTKYGAPHLTVTDGHVLLTDEGNLVASRGFRTGIADPEILREAQPPPLQELEAPEEEEEELIPEGDIVPALPERRLQEKTTVRFIDGGVEEDNPDNIARIGLLDGDFSDELFRRATSALQKVELPTTDRRGELKGRFVLGAYAHGGNRGVTD
ncbi:GIP, partial [Symbiodinium necroappetens]